MWIRYVGIALGSIVWAGIVFAAGVDLAFPSDAAKAWLRWQVESQSKEQWTFDATDIDAWRLSGVTAKDLTLYKVARRVRGTDQPTPVTPFAHADRFSARLELLPFLATFGKARRVDYKATVFGSDIKGVVGKTGSVTQVLARTKALDLAKVPIDGESWSVDLTGKVNLDIDLEVDAEEIENSQGHIKLAIDDLALAGGEAMGSQFSDIAGDALPATFSEAVLEFEVKDGKAEVTKGRFVSEPIELDVSGDIQLRKDLERSRINLEITLKLNESLDRLARIVPVLSSGRDADGTYHLGATGTVMSPRLREERVTTGARSPSKRKTSALPGGELGDPDEGSQSQEEREKARAERLERLKERRERMREQQQNAPGATDPEGRARRGEEPPFDEGPIINEEEGPLPLDPAEEDPIEPPPEHNEQEALEQGYTE
jgi:type II secretion system protein N